MPYSFTQIEEDKTKTIAFVFSFLILIYFSVFLAVALLITNFYQYQVHPSVYSFSYLNFSQSILILGAALMLGYGHWVYSTANLIQKMLGVLKAEPLNPKDTYHQMFQNIIEEVSIATGGRKIEGVVVPTMATNAFALADFDGRAVIGVTEGLLARLTRAQIEALVGHEAAHIVTGDCLSTTVTSSLFELISGLLKGFESMFKGGGRGYSSGRASGSGIALLALVAASYALLLFTKMLSQLVRLFISRQREYRADAIAVRLTRDPLSLAEALYGIRYRWRGAGLPSQEMEAIFIVSPVYAAINEESGTWAEMFSTHPPMESRLAVLLDMAHTDVEVLVEQAEHKSQRPRTTVPEVGVASEQWMVNKEGAWQGPFNLAQMTTLGWMRPETWVQRVGGRNVQMAYEDKTISGIIHKENGVRQSSSFQCPKCQLPLNLITYEGTEAYKCSSCRGTLVRENDIQRIIIRQEVGFSDRIKRIAEGIRLEEKQGTFKLINRDPKTLLMCPKCQHDRARMNRMFYTEVYRVEIDKCFMCGCVWFDADELEVLQYLIEQSAHKSHS